MKKLFSLLSFGFAVAIAEPVAAQVPQPTPDNTIPHPTGPGILSSIEVYNYLVTVVGADPFVAADIITHSEFVYGMFFTIDQALMFLPPVPAK